MKKYTIYDFLEYLQSDNKNTQKMGLDMYFSSIDVNNPSEEDLIFWKNQSLSHLTGVVGNIYIYIYMSVYSDANAKTSNLDKYCYAINRKIKI